MTARQTVQLIGWIKKLPLVAGAFFALVATATGEFGENNVRRHPFEDHQRSPSGAWAFLAGYGIPIRPKGQLPGACIGALYDFIPFCCETREYPWQGVGDEQPTILR